MKNNEDKMSLALSRLRDAQQQKQDTEVQLMLEAREQVFARYRPIFASASLDNLSKEDFYSFLLFENNKHWSHLHRQGNRITNDMESLRRGLKILLDETQDIYSRLDRLRPRNGNPIVPGAGKAILTAILFVAYPDRYGVWNQRSEDSLRNLGLLDEFTSKESFADRYLKVNGLLLALSTSLQIDLWTLDALLWRVDTPIDGPSKGDAVGIPGRVEESYGAEFAFERHLEDLLVENWDLTDLSKEWDLFWNDGEAAQQYATKVGLIDLLARHKTKSQWLVIELKKGSSSDAVVGQVTRYMGWVKEHLANSSDTVEGLIVSGELDEKLRYSIRQIPNVRHMRYKLDLKLIPSDK
ncbi:MAG: endonuclease NucS domain-containing protein [Candidatus Zixiibacteriota bacterium]